MNSECDLQVLRYLLNSRYNGTRMKARSAFSELEHSARFARPIVSTIKYKY